MKQRLVDLAMEGEIEAAIKKIKRRHQAEQRLCDEINPAFNGEREDEWLSFIKRKDVKEAIGTGWYLGWCLCWDKAYQKGLEDGRKQSC